MRNATDVIGMINIERYEQLVRDREKYKNMLLKGGITRIHKIWLEEQIHSIRMEIKNAHREQNRARS